MDVTGRPTEKGQGTIKWIGLPLFIIDAMVDARPEDLTWPHSHSSKAGLHQLQIGAKNASL
jgi:hypothetical protein